MNAETVSSEVVRLAQQLGLDLNLIFHEVYWALGEERINVVTPTYDQFKEWTRQKDGLNRFWEFANNKLGSGLKADELQDIWE